MITDREVLPFKEAIRPNYVRELDEDGAPYAIAYTPGRLQPYAVWYRGKIQRFCETLPEAEKRLRAATGGLDDRN